jgi:membrane protein DedA with SNARE-associated domain
MRFVPGFRALISFPAGFGRMKIVKFIGATFLGHLIWDTILAYLGYTYSSSWNTLISVVDQYLNYIAAVLAVVIIAYLIFLFIKTRTR